ncbi:MAG: VOC family protein [Schleiferiaceae bacterium]|nr:VOC family protein [Schleiferiaceae bacterium]
MKFHHIGYLVGNLDKYLKLSRIKKNDLVSFSDKIQQAELHLVTLPDGYLELIVPWEGSKLKEELKKKKDGFHHICYLCETKDEYLSFRNHHFKIAGPYYSVMFKSEIEFYYKSDLIIEIVKNYE